MNSVARTLRLALGAAMSGGVGVLAAGTDGAAMGAADIEAAATLRHVAMQHSTIDSGPIHAALGNGLWGYVWHSRQTIDQLSLPGTFGPATVNCISIGSHPQNGPFHRTCVLVDADGDQFSYVSTNSPSPRMYGVADSIIIGGAGKYKNLAGEVHSHSTSIEASPVRLDTKTRGWSVISYRQGSWDARSLPGEARP